MRTVTFTLCPAYDLHCTAERFTVGREHSAVLDSFDAGGKGVNVSRALKALDTDSLCAVLVGEEDREDFLRRLSKDGLRTRSLSFPGAIRRNITVHSDSETRISFDGFSAGPEAADWVRSVSDQLAEGDFAALCGRIPKGIEKDEIAGIFRGLSRRGVKIAVDCGSLSPEEIISMRPFLIKPNAQEAERFFGSDPRDSGALTDAAKRIRDAGVENVMISLGAGGAILAAPDGEFSVAAPEVETVSTIGAGDSAVAGFIAAHQRGFGSRDKLICAVACGSAACLQRGTRPPEAGDIARLTAKMGGKTWLRG